MFSKTIYLPFNSRDLARLITHSWVVEGPEFANYAQPSDVDRDWARELLLSYSNYYEMDTGRMTPDQFRETDHFDKSTTDVIEQALIDESMKPSTASMADDFRVLLDELYEFSRYCATEEFTDTSMLWQLLTPYLDTYRPGHDEPWPDEDNEEGNK